jgi:hypothetical protein
VRRQDRTPAIIGAAIGLAISGYALVYAPMQRNYDQCGKVTLCAPQAKGDRNER